MYDMYAFLKNPSDYPFDIEQMPDPYHYFESLMDESGNVFEAPNGHSQGVMMLLAQKWGVTASVVSESCPHVSFWHEWLLKESGVIMIWHDRCVGQSFNEAQLAMLKTLQEKGHISPIFLCTAYHYHNRQTEIETFCLKKALI